jgi:hypothetical protein
MRISNDASFADASWEALADEKPWTLDNCDPTTGICFVCAQVRDAAMNESAVVFDEILMWQVYLPILLH